MDCHKNARLTALSREMLARKVVEQRNSEDRGQVGEALSGAGTGGPGRPQFASAPALSVHIERADRARGGLAPAALDRLPDRAAYRPQPGHREPHPAKSEAQPHPCSYDSSQQRNQKLIPWLHAYNWHRPHAGLNHQTPISRSGLDRNNLLSHHS